MKELNLGLTVTLATAMGASPALAQTQEPAKVSLTESAEVATVAQPKLPLQLISTPMAEAMPSVEFSARDLLKQPEANSPLSTDLAPSPVTQTVTVVSPTIEPYPNSSVSVEAIELTVLKTEQETIFNHSSTPKATNAESKKETINPVEQTDLRQIAQQTLGEQQLQEKLQQLEQRQQQLEQEINTLKQQTTTPAQTPTQSVVTVPEDRPQSLSIYTQPIFLKTRLSIPNDFAIVDQGTALATSGTIATVELEEATALRVGLSYRPANTAWTIGATHTFFDADGAASVVRPDTGFLFSTLSHPFQNDSADTANATTKLRYSATDAELGYDFQVGKGLGVRLFSGLRFSDLNQSTAVVYNGRDYTNGKVDLSNNFSGFGPRIGAEAKVLLGGGFSLFSKGSVSLLFGELSSSFQETDRDGADVIAKVGRDRNQTVPVVDLAIGLDWVTALSRSSKLNLSVGYEYQQWFNAIDNIRFVDSASPGVFSASQSDLSLQGLFIKAGLSFEF